MKKKKVIILNEDTSETLKDAVAMTKFKFKSNIKRFLASLLEDPVGTQPNEFLKFHHLTKNKLIKYLEDNKIITRRKSIDDQYSDGTPHTPNMNIKYDVPAKRFNDRLDALYDTLYPQMVNEDGGGAASCSGVDGNGFGSGEFTTPLFGMMRRSSKKKQNEGKKYVLTESTKDVRNRMMRVVPEETMKEFLGTNKGYNDLVGDGHGNKIFQIVNLYNKIRHKFGAFANSNFLPGLYRIAVTELGWNTKNVDNINIDLLTKMVYELLQSGEKLDWNLNNMSFFDLYKLYGVRIEEEEEKEMEMGEKQQNDNPKEQVVNKGYTIVRIESFKEAKLYGDKSYPDSKLCYTQRTNIFYEYGGLTTNSVYVCLKDGWEDIKPILGNDPEHPAPFDEYGLSMIFVFVNPNGDIAYCNTRWNHEHSENYDVDHIMNKRELMNVLGINKFSNYFKPLVESIKGNFVIHVNNAIKSLMRGNDLKDIFDTVERHSGYDLVCLDDKWNILINNKILTPRIWYDIIKQKPKSIDYIRVKDFYKGETWISLRGGENPISKKWYYSVDDFNKNGIACIEISKDEYNWVRINNPDKPISSINYKFVTDFDKNGIACVYVYDKGGNWVSINNPEKPLSTRYYRSVIGFNNQGIALVSVSNYGERNWVSINDMDTCLSSVNYKSITDFNSFGIAAVCIPSKGYNWVSIKNPSHVLFDYYYQECGNFNNDGIAWIVNNKGYNWVSIKDPSKPISSVYYSYVGNFDNYGFAIVRINKETSYYNNRYGMVNIKNPSKIISNREYSNISSFNKYGIYTVEKNEKFNWIDIHDLSHELSDIWYDDCVENDYNDDNYNIRVYLKSIDKWFILDLRKPNQLLDDYTLQPVDTEEIKRRLIENSEDDDYNNLFESVISNKMPLTESTKDVRNRMMRVVPEDTMKELLGTDKGYNDFVNDERGNQVTQIVNLYNKIRTHRFEPFANSNFLPGIYRIAITELGWCTGNFDTTNADLLVKMVYELLQSGEKLDWNLNNMSFFDLYKLYGMKIEDESINDENKDVSEQNSEENDNPKEQRVDNGYTIVRIESFKEANFYGNESCPDSKLCYTQSPFTFAEYGGLTKNSVYVCLKDGWEDIQPIPGENAPFDEYGLSMIFVFIDHKGEISTCNTRWNHKHSGEYHVDNILDKYDLIKLLGINFYSVFKPLDNINISFKAQVNNIIKKLMRGEDPKDIFDDVEQYNGYSIVRFGNLGDRELNVLIGNRLLSPYIWYSYIYKTDTKNTFIVEKNFNDKWNILKEDGNFVTPNTWYNEIRNSGARNVFIVKKDGKYNYLKTDGNFITPDTWYEYAAKFCDGIAIVKDYNERYNYLKLDGTTIFDEYQFNSLNEFRYGWGSGINSKTGSWCYIDKNGKLFEFENIDIFHIDIFKHGISVITTIKNHKVLCNAVNTDMRLLWNKPVEDWFDWIDGRWRNGYLKCRLGRKYNTFKQNGELICKGPLENWYDYIGVCKSGYFRVRLWDKWNYINEDCKLLWRHPVDEWFDWSGNFNGDTAIVKINNRRYYLRLSTKSLSLENIPVNESVTGDDINKSAALYVYGKEDNDWYVLCAKRIEGDESGKINPPMGHLHKGETYVEGALRECYEESGIDFCDYEDEIETIDTHDWGANLKLVIDISPRNYKANNGDGENSKFRWIKVSNADRYSWAWDCLDIVLDNAPSDELNEATATTSVGPGDSPSGDLAYPLFGDKETCDRDYQKRRNGSVSMGAERVGNSNIGENKKIK